MSRPARPCRNCSGVVRADYEGDRCPWCLAPMRELVVPQKKGKGRKAKRLREREVYSDREPRSSDGARHQRRRERREVRRELRRELHSAFEQAEPGNPLGRGMPLGAPLREDTESHREAWMRIVRGDPCSYCGRRPFPCRFHGEGTIDHIIPRAARTPGLHTWLNYAGACPSCNGSKSDTPLLLWLARRPVVKREGKAALGAGGSPKPAGRVRFPASLPVQSEP